MYNHVFVGGTFDGLHRGHETMLVRAFAEGTDVTIGLTSDRFIKAYKSGQPIKLFEERKIALNAWLQDKGFLSRAVIVPIDDPFEPAASSYFEALLVTADNKYRGDQINQTRLSRKLKPLVLIEVDLAKSEDGVVISSTRLRSGEIDKEGKLLMPEDIRAILQKPIGRLIPTAQAKDEILKHKDGVIITVGDMTTKTALDAGLIPCLSIIDFHVGRKPYEDISLLSFGDTPVSSIHSGPGHISYAAITAIQEWAEIVSKAKDNIHRLHQVIVVSGEEDLLTLPVIIHAPFGSHVYYGQPDEGMVEIEVTDERKKEALELFSKFN